ncbi:hypothetical protein GA0074692_0459 [Micromonospora pallida]|uniref:Uncharacterized protein n=1 Tax=Micromonospora pallida TaxID=145854 RepID=A0A1C6RNF6_9ACTN|nr:hypothetical protein [Micromonospora pallida]SCL18717.1 hypothetical protein GA0074692_0459 [Micromonospora pallida]
MSSFEDYAALARHLAEQRRADDRRADAETGRRRRWQADVDQLDQRLTAQQEWLAELGAAIGAPFRTVDPDGPPEDREPTTDGTTYRELPVGPPRPALPTSDPARVDGSAALRTVDPGSPPPGPAAPPPPLDPAEELTRVRSSADEADRYGRQVEARAGQPRLLPGWSPLARAIVVYLGSALVGALAVAVLVLVANAGWIDSATLAIWTVAGIPALAFFAGFLLLGRYGRPAVGGASPPRHLNTGFVICFLLLPAVSCGYLLLARGG